LVFKASYELPTLSYTRTKLIFHDWLTGISRDESYFGISTGMSRRDKADFVLLYGIVKFYNKMKIMVKKNNKAIHTTISIINSHNLTNYFNTSSWFSKLRMNSRPSRIPSGVCICVSEYRFSISFCNRWIIFWYFYGYVKEGQSRFCPFIRNC
jgi:hypothetical protein